MPNFAFTRGLGLPNIPQGGVFEGYNFTQAKPHTKIFVGRTGLTFKGCNLVNCDVPIGSVIIDCLHIHKEFCSNKHPKWVAKGINKCVDNCSHYVESITDKEYDKKTGVLLKEDVVKVYEDKLVK